MAKTWLEASQENFGMILKGLSEPHMYSPKDFFYPYDEMLEYMLENETWCKEDLYLKFANTYIDSALHAAQSINGQSKEVSFPDILKTTSKLYSAGDNFERVGRALKKGEVPEMLHLRSDMDAITSNQSLGAERASEIDLTEVADLQPSGWKEVDNTFGGMPVTGPLVLYGTMGTGKSFLTTKYVKEYLKYYETKKAGVYSLEMSGKRYLKRALTMYPDIKNVLDRLWISGKAKNIEDITAEASKEDFDLVVIDSIDYLPDKEISASVMDRIWKAIVRMGRLLEIPVIVTAQPNREAKWRTKEQFLQKYDIAWSGSSEDAAEQLIAIQYIQNATNFHGEDFIAYDESYYMISWKQRGGWPMGKGPGAIIFHEKDAVTNKDGYRTLWEGKVLGNMLWKAGESKRVGKQSSRIKKEKEE